MGTIGSDMNVSDVAEALEEHRKEYKGVLDTDHMVGQFDYQLELSRRIRECAMQLYEDAANIASGVLHVRDLSITIDIVSLGETLECPTIDINKSYYPRVTIERMMK